MSDPRRPEKESEEAGEPERSGPSLTLMYSLLALALALAIGCAIMIVLPFYHRR